MNQTELKDITFPSNACLPIMGDDKPMIIVLTGIPACGKSTYAKFLREKRPSLHIVESDAIRSLSHPRPNYSKVESQEVFNLVRAHINIALDNGEGVIVDATSKNKSAPV